MKTSIIKTDIRARLKSKEYFQNHPDFIGQDISFLKNMFNREVTIKSVNTINKSCLVEGIFGVRFYPEDFVK